MVGKFASGNALIPGADITDTGEKFGRGPIKVPKAPVFNGGDVLYPSWSQNVLLSARHNNLYKAFVSEIDILIATAYCLVEDSVGTVWLPSLFQTPSMKPRWM